MRMSNRTDGRWYSFLRTQGVANCIGGNGTQFEYFGCETLFLLLLSCRGFLDSVSATMAFTCPSVLELFPLGSSLRLSMAATNSDLTTCFKVFPLSYVILPLRSLSRKINENTTTTNEFTSCNNSHCFHFELIFQFLPFAAFDWRPSSQVLPR